MPFVIDKDTQIYLSLSERPSDFGTRFHNFLFRELGVNAIYKAVATLNIEDALTGIKALGIAGCAVSMPFKERAMTLVDQLDATAEAVGALNTVLNRNRMLIGFNTDALALIEILKAQVTLKTIALNSSILVFGTGGMAKALLYALHTIGFENVSLLGRDAMKLNALKTKYGCETIVASGINGQSPARIKEKKFDALLNATSIGMAPSTDECPFPVDLIENARVILDSVASPVDTTLIRRASKLGKTTITGGEIRVLQAVRQFLIYTGQRPGYDLVSEAEKLATGGGARTR